MLKKSLSLVLLIVFVAQNFILFLGTGIKHDLKFWISYGFVVIAYVQLQFFTYWQEESSMEYFFALTRIRVCQTYVVLALIAAVQVNLIDNVPQVVFYGVQTAIMVFYIILLIFLSKIDDKHSLIEKEVQNKKQFTIAALEEINMIRVNCSSELNKRKIDQIIDMLRAAPSSKSNERLPPEQAFMDNLDKLEYAISTKSEEECDKILDSLIDDLKMRNIMLS